MDSNNNEEARLDTNVLVAVRCRPLSTKEKNNNEQSCVRFLSDQIMLVNPSGNGDDHSFGFDLIFDEQSQQDQVWKEVGLPILNKALAGYNGTIFAYGQTGSGKTWSMQGGDGDLKGIIPRMNASIFERISDEKQRRPTVQFLVTVSYFEIYNEVIFDLLDPTDRKKRSKGGLEIKEHPALGVYVKGLQEIVTENASQLESIIDQGMKHRTVASTQMNADSSRSHSVFVVSIHQKDETKAGGNVFAKMNLVDLAGSERVKSTGATGATLKEGANINKSLSALGNVINALVECSKGKSTFIPYRNSKLTRVLQESLGGNSITSMLAALSPAACNFEETLSTLKYANRAKAIKVKAVKNEEATQINRLQEEIRLLKEKLQQQQQQGPDESSGLEIDDKARTKLKELEEAARNTWEQKAQLSSQYEHERTQLLAEQQYAYRQLELAKEKAWSLLVRKEQMDSVLVYMKECIQTYLQSTDPTTEKNGEQQATGDAVRSNVTHKPLVSQLSADDIGKHLETLVNSFSVATWDFNQLNLVVDGWLSSLQQLVQQEQSAKDEYLMLTMIKTALSTDIQSLSKLRINSSKAMDQPYLVNLLEQAKEKLLSLVDGLPRLLNVQSLVIQLFSRLNNQYQRIHSAFHEGMSKRQQQGVIDSGAESVNEISKCLALLLTQIDKQSGNYMQTVDQTRRVLLDHSLLRQEIDYELSFYDSHVEKLRKDNDDLPDKSSMQSINKLLASCRQAQGIVVKLDQEYSVAKNDLDETSSNNNEPPAFHQQSPSSVAVSRSNSIRNSPPRPVVVPLSCATLRSMVGRLNLPCGISWQKILSSASVNDLNSLVAMTEHALADIISWEKLLGTKHQPGKLLSRPPVRFLFDLIQHLVNTVTMESGKGNQLPLTPLASNIDEMLGSTNWQASTVEDMLLPLTADWAEVSASKESKLAYMEKLLRFVCLCGGGDAITTAVNIVTGSRPELSNSFLQQLALIIYALQRHFQPERSEQAQPPQQIQDLNSKTEDLTRGLTGSKAFKEVSLITDQAVSNYLQSMKLLVEEMASMVKAVAAFEQSLRVFRQEQQKKTMESLAQEKAQLAAALASEKQSLLSNNQSLSEQILVYQSQLEEMKHLLDKEAQYSATLEEIRDNLQKEQSKLQQELLDKESQVNKLSSQLFKCEAVMEKDKLTINNMQSSLESYQQSIEDMKSSLAEYQSLDAQYRNEKEEANSNLTVLTEERDAARQHEEELFEQLTEVTTNLESLQESYIRINDRCNDLFDENMELKEELSQLRETLLTTQREYLHRDVYKQSGTNEGSHDVQPTLQYSADVKSSLDVSVRSTGEASPQSSSILKESKKSSSKPVSSPQRVPPQPATLPQSNIHMETVQMTHLTHPNPPVSSVPHTQEVYDPSAHDSLNLSSSFVKDSIQHDIAEKKISPDGGADDDYQEDFDN